MKIETAYNLWAENYDFNTNRTRDLDRVATIRTLSKYSFSDVLELGCGTGKNTEWLLEIAATITGLDFSTEMLERAMEKVQSNQVEFKQCDLRKSWGVPDSRFDLITSSLTLEHIEDLTPIFQQAGEKLQPNGHFFISELHPFKQYTGSKARFNKDDEVIELETYVHHLTDYTDAATSAQFSLIEIKEWFDDDPKSNTPRLISFVFKKQRDI